MNRIQDYEKILLDLEGQLTTHCRELREKLDQVYDQDPARALETTESLSQVFRKLKTLRDRGEILRDALDALKVIEELKSEIMSKVEELGPEYVRYRTARRKLAGAGDQELETLCAEAYPGFTLAYGELEGAPIGPFRALNPDAFAGAGDGDPAPAPPVVAPRAVEPVRVPVAAPAGPASRPPPPFAAVDAFAAEAGPARPRSVPPPRAPMPPAPEPKPDRLDPDPMEAMQAVFGGASEGTEPASGGSAAADLMSMMDDETLSPPPVAPPAAAPRPPAAPAPTPGESAGALAADLLAELDDEADLLGPGPDPFGDLGAKPSTGKTPTGTGAKPSGKNPLDDL